MTPVQTTSIHGVFMNIFGIGVLLTGKSGSGKSELALALLNRGHQLIADDMCEFTENNDQAIIGCAPALLKNFLEVRGLGIFNILQLFGAKAIKNKQQLSLIIHLEKTTVIERATQTDSITEHELIFNIPVPRMTLPYISTRHFEVLIELLVRNFMGGFKQEHSFDFLQQSAISADSNNFYTTR